MEENKKINTQIVIMVVIVIILILSLLGILLYVVNDNKKIVSNNNTNTTTTTTTVSVVIDKKAIANEVIEEYLTLLKNQDKISDFQYELSLLDEEDYCSGMEYFPDKIYVSVKVIYKRVDNSFMITENDNNTDSDSEDIFESSATYVISMVDGKYQIEEFYIGC